MTEQLLERIDRRTADRMLRGLNRYTIAAMCSKCDRASLQSSCPHNNRRPLAQRRSITSCNRHKGIDYNRRLIIYRDEEPRRQLQKFEYPKDERIYGESQNLYEDYYEEIYEYFHD